MARHISEGGIECRAEPIADLQRRHSETRQIVDDGFFQICGAPANAGMVTSTYSSNVNPIVIPILSLQKHKETLSLAPFVPGRIRFRSADARIFLEILDLTRQSPFSAEKNRQGGDDLVSS